MKKFLPIIFLIGLVAVPSLARYRQGDLVANFTLPDTGGNPVSLYQFSDKIVGIYFWASN